RLTDRLRTRAVTTQGSTLTDRTSPSDAVRASRPRGAHDAEAIVRRRRLVRRLQVRPLRAPRLRFAHCDGLVSERSTTAFTESARRCEGVGSKTVTTRGWLPVGLGGRAAGYAQLPSGGPHEDAFAIRLMIWPEGPYQISRPGLRKVCETNAAMLPCTVAIT